MFYTLIKHRFLTNQSARRVLSMLEYMIKEHCFLVGHSGCSRAGPAQDSVHGASHIIHVVNDHASIAKYH